MSPKSQEPGKLVTTTVRDYDLAEVSKLVSRYLIVSLTGQTFNSFR